MAGRGVVDASCLVNRHKIKQITSGTKEQTKETITKRHKANRMHRNWTGRDYQTRNWKRLFCLRNRDSAEKTTIVGLKKYFQMAKGENMDYSFISESRVLWINHYKFVVERGIFSVRKSRLQWWRTNCTAGEGVGAFPYRSIATLSKGLHINV